MRRVSQTTLRIKRFKNHYKTKQESTCHFKPSVCEVFEVQREDPEIGKIKAFMANILGRAISDLLSVAEDNESIRHKISAREWIYAKEDYTDPCCLFSFLGICEVLGLDPGRLITVLKESEVL